jgi:hypothetical protein
VQQKNVTAKESTVNRENVVKLMGGGNQARWLKSDFRRGRSSEMQADILGTFPIKLSHKFIKMYAFFSLT